VRDLKIIDGASGPFVAMPSRKLTAHCPRCGMKNHLRAQYCNQCGHAQSQERMPLDADGRAKLYADIAHPINSSCREMIQESVIREYEAEVERAKQPDYVSRYDDFDMDYNDCRRAPAAAGEARIDAAHRDAVAGSHYRPSGGDSARPRGSAPPRTSSPSSTSASSSRGPQRPRHGGFGAGIFPEE
jgi:stage V sporulation protein G